MREEGVHHLFREDLGRWVLFHVQGPAATPPLGGDPGWWWKGLGAVKTDPQGKSRYLATLAQNAYRDGRTARALTCPGRPWRPYASNHHGAARRSSTRWRDSAARPRPSRSRGALRRADRASGEDVGRVRRDAGAPRVYPGAGARQARTGRQGQVLLEGEAGSRPDGGDRRLRPRPRVDTTKFQGDHHFLGGHEKGIWPTLEDEIFTRRHGSEFPRTPSPGRIEGPGGGLRSPDGEEMEGLGQRGAGTSGARAGRRAAGRGRRSPVTVTPRRGSTRIWFRSADFSRLSRPLAGAECRWTLWSE